MKKIIPFLLLSSLAQAQTITLDIGHYIKSPGTVSAYGDYEFYYNKELAQYIAQSLSQQGFRVNVQGFNGDLSSLSQRGQMSAGSNLLISVHHDAIQAQHLQKWIYNKKEQIYNDEVKGYGIFVSSKNPYYAQSLLCAKHIALNLLKSGFSPNYYHNLDIPNEKKALLDKTLPVYQYDNLIVLKSTSVPAILIEAGVLTNRQEALYIRKPEVRQAFSLAVAKGAKDCLTS